MECRKATKLVDKYIDNRLEGTILKDFEKHLGECFTCSVELEEQKKFIQSLDIKSPVKAPYRLTENIMKEVSSLHLYSFDQKHHKPSNEQGIFLKRLGMSMIAAAAILVLSMCFPSGKYNILASSSNAHTNVIMTKTWEISNELDEVSYKIGSFFRGINKKMSK